MPVKKVSIPSNFNSGSITTNTGNSTIPNSGIIDNPVTPANYPTYPVNETGLKTNIQPIPSINPLVSEDGSIEFIINVVDEPYVPIPNIIQISYPSEITPSDYTGYDTNFDISWESVNASYVRIFVGNSDKYVELPANSSTTLNVETILKHYLEFEDVGLRPTDSDFFFKFKLRLIPYSASPSGIISGEPDVIDFTFDKSDIAIPFDVVINRIAEGFVSQFNYDFVEESNYLTHLLHLGNGDNRIITTWVGLEEDNLEKSLILKLYEPLPTTVQPNQLVWISKIQSNPIIETVTMVGVDVDYCPPLKGPNFSIEPDNGIGFQVFDELLASGSFTSEGLVRRYISKNIIDTGLLNIEYVSNSEFNWENFVHFGSAEERVKNFWYKLKLIETYESIYTELTGANINYAYLTAEDGKILLTEFSIPIEYESPSLNATLLIEIKNLINKINNVFATFDGFETFLYLSLDSLAYPKNGNNVAPTTSAEGIAWYNSTVLFASNFDFTNVNYLNNNIPEFIREDYQNAEFMLFMDMIGQHFDIIWVYINSLTKLKKLNQQSSIGFPNELVYYMLESFGWGGKKAYDSEFLWEYLFGQYKDGTIKYSQPLKNANEEVWRRIINNLPYMLKHKGTARSLKAVMACYGVPSTLLTIMEFGGPQDPTSDNSVKFTFEDITAAITLSGFNHINVPWGTINNALLNSLEFRYKSDYPTSGSLIKSLNSSETQTYWNLSLVPTTSTKATLSFQISGSSSTVYSASIGEFNFFDGSYNQIVINRIETTSGSNFSVIVKKSIGDRISYSSETTLSIPESTQWNITGSNRILQLGNGFSGSLDEFRIWKTPLEDSVIEIHTLLPDSISGNSYTASTSDLVFRNDFEYPKDRWLDPNILNVSINTEYPATASIAVGFSSGSLYPYQYEPYERIVTATMPSLGFNYSDKIRFESHIMVSDLSHKSRATKKSFDQSPIDSNRLGLFFSPNKELNMDIVKSFGRFNIDNYIGSPDDYYREQYSDLRDLRNYYFQRLNRNTYEYIQLVKYINKSLFDVLIDLIPVRAKVSKGLLIEPHYLERSKIKWERPLSERADYESSINVDDTFLVQSNSDSYEGDLKNYDVIEVESAVTTYDGSVVADDTVNIVTTVLGYNGDLVISDVSSVSGESAFYDSSIFVKTGESTTQEIDEIKLEQVGLDNEEFGLWGYNGVSIIKTLDIFGNVSSSKYDVYRVKQNYSASVKVQTEGWPATTSSEHIKYETQTELRFRYLVTKLPLEAAPLTPTGDITEVIPINGYFPGHYRYKANLSEGLQSSFFKGSKQNSSTTPDGLPPIEVFTTNPNILKVADTGRGSSEPILETN